MFFSISASDRSDSVRTAAHRASRRSARVIRDSSYCAPCPRRRRRARRSPPSAGAPTAAGGDVGSEHHRRDVQQLGESCTSAARNVRQCRVGPLRRLRPPAPASSRREHRVPHLRVDRVEQRRGLDRRRSGRSSSNVGVALEQRRPVREERRSRRSSPSAPSGVSRGRDEQRDVEVGVGGARVRQGDDGEGSVTIAHAPAKARQYSDHAGEVPSAARPSPRRSSDRRSSRRTGARTRSSPRPRRRAPRP